MVIRASTVPGQAPAEAQAHRGARRRLWSGARLGGYSQRMSDRWYEQGTMFLLLATHRQFGLNLKERSCTPAHYVRCLSCYPNELAANLGLFHVESGLQARKRDHWPDGPEPGQTSKRIHTQNKSWPIVLSCMSTGSRKGESEPKPQDNRTIAVTLLPEVPFV